MIRADKLLVTAVAAIALALPLTACGVEEDIVHLQAAPTEDTSGAPVEHEAAERIATRVLAEAALATTEEEREAVIIGPAAHVISARVAAKVQGEVPSELAVPEAPIILAVSDSATWPRAILASDLDESAQVQSVHILVSESSTDQFQLFATAPMFPGTAVPSLGRFEDGATFESGTKDEPIEAVEVAEAYAAALAFPKPKVDKSVSIDDPFAAGLKKSGKAIDKENDDLATRTQTHTVRPESVVRFETADGGNLIFAQLNRKDTFTSTSKAKELKINDKVLQKLSGKKTVRKTFEVRSLQNILIGAPANGPASLIGAEEILLSAKGE